MTSAFLPVYNWTCWSTSEIDKKIDFDWTKESTEGLRLPSDVIYHVGRPRRSAGSRIPTQSVIKVQRLNGQIFRSRKGEAECCWNRQWISVTTGGCTDVLDVQEETASHHNQTAARHQQRSWFSVQMFVCPCPNMLSLTEDSWHSKEAEGSPTCANIVYPGLQWRSERPDFKVRDKQ